MILIYFKRIVNPYTFIWILSYLICFTWAILWGLHLILRYKKLQVIFKCPFIRLNLIVWEVGGPIDKTGRKATNIVRRGQPCPYIQYCSYHSNLPLHVKNVEVIFTTLTSFKSIEPWYCKFFAFFFLFIHEKSKNLKRFLKWFDLLYKVFIR